MRRRHDSNIAYLDMLFMMLIVMTFMMVMSVLQIRPPSEIKKGVELKAEFMLQLTWPDKAPDDIDLWLMLPDGQKVFYRNRDSAVYATLDRDDMGIGNDYYFEGNTKHYVWSNKEIITVRAIVPGRYVSNVMVFSQNHEGDDEPGIVHFPYSAKVTLTKLNPKVQDVATKEILLSKVGQQATAFAFTVDQNGDVTVDLDADEPFIPLTERK